MRRSILTAVILSCSLGFMGCPGEGKSDTPAEPNGTETTTEESTSAPAGEGEGETTTEGGETTTEGGGDAADAGGISYDVSTAKAGQKYMYSMAAAPNMKMVYEVKEVDEDAGQVTYVSYTLMEGMDPDPNEPMQWPGEVAETTGETTTEGPQAEMTELDPTTISGIEFGQLEVKTEAGGSVIPTLPGKKNVYVFPPMLRSFGADGATSMELTEVAE